MKRNAAVLILLLASVMTLSAQNYWTGDGGAAAIGSLRIERARGENLASNDNWLPGSIQRSLISYFTEFSAIRVVDIENAALIDATRRGSRSDLIDEKTQVEIGKGTAAKYILTGVLTYTGERFTLHIQVTSVETNALVAAADQPNIPSTRVRDMTVIKSMTVELLGKLGVRLTDAGKAALLKNTTETDELLARADAAKAAGNRVAEMAYLYNAQSFDTKNREAANRISFLSSRNGGSLGTRIAEDFEMQKQWNQYLKDFDEFYRNHLPFVLYFTPPTDTNEHTYEENPRFSLSFKVGLRPSKDGVEAMEKVMKQMDTELKGTKNKDKWGFSHWPVSSPLFTGDGHNDFRFDVVYRVVNQNGEVILVDQTMQFSLTAGLIQSNYRVYPDCEQEQSITIRNINYTINSEKIAGSDFSIEIVSINGIAAEAAGQIGYMRIIPVSSMPQKIEPKYPGNILAEQKKQKRELKANKTKESSAQVSKRILAAAINPIGGIGSLTQWDPLGFNITFWGEAIGISLLIVGAYFPKEEYDPFTTETIKVYEQNLPMMISGGIITGAVVLFSVIRPFTYKRENSAASLVNPGNWNVSFIPGPDAKRLNAVRVAYRFSY
ncbi:hypothetical protein AGMMS4952_03170 [Spirochaetia bacterium]|nr:hypothetical protein AGMMS4952_03170 [Spirochaetia bacterium]